MGIRDFQKEYNSWRHMNSRCYSKDDPAYKNYGGRGISVCERWRNSFLYFLEDMGKSPSPTHTIDRIDNDCGYSKENCRWATKKEQAGNRRKIAGPTIRDVAKMTGVDAGTLYARLKRGWSISEATTIQAGIGTNRWNSPIDAVRDVAALAKQDRDGEGRFS